MVGCHWRSAHLRGRGNDTGHGSRATGTATQGYASGAFACVVATGTGLVAGAAGGRVAGGWNRLVAT